MAKVPSDLNHVFKTLVPRRHCLAFLKGLHVPGFSVTLPETSIPASPAHPSCSQLTQRPVRWFAQEQWKRMKKLSLGSTANGFSPIFLTPEGFCQATGRR